MSLQGAASSYLCPVAGYMCTEGSNLCGRRIRTKRATDFRSVSLQPFKIKSYAPLFKMQHISIQIAKKYYTFVISFYYQVLQWHYPKCFQPYSNRGVREIVNKTKSNNLSFETLLCLWTFVSKSHEIFHHQWCLFNGMITTREANLAAGPIVLICLTVCGK